MSKPLKSLRDFVHDFTERAERHCTKKERQKIRNIQITIDGNERDVTVLLFDKRSLFKTIRFTWEGYLK